MDLAALEIIKYQDVAARALADPAFEVFRPLPGAGRAADEVALAIATKAAREGENAFTVDGKTMSVTGVISDEREPDRAKEVLVLDGLDTSGWGRNPMMCFQHHRDVPLGLWQDPNTKSFTVRRAGKTLLGTGYFVQTGPMAPFAVQAFQLCESKVLNGISIGFVAAWKDYDRRPDDPAEPYGPATTFIRKSKAFEASLVFIPENDRSLITEVVRKGLSGGGGTAPVPLLPVLKSLLAPYADPGAAWAPGATLPAAPDPTPTPAATTEQDKGVTTPNTTPPAPTPTPAATPTPTPAAIPADVLALAEDGKWWNEAVGKGLGLRLGDYEGKPSQKMLEAIHDVALFNVLSVTESMTSVEGGAEQFASQYVKAQCEMCVKAADEYQRLYGEPAPWAAVTPADVYESRFTEEQQYKTLLGKALMWAVKTTGWTRAHHKRVHGASAVLKTLAELPAAAPIPDGLRASALEQVKRLNEMIGDGGISLHPVEDDDVEKALKDQAAAIEKITADNVALRKKISKLTQGFPLR